MLDIPEGRMMDLFAHRQEYAPGAGHRDYLRRSYAGDHTPGLEVSERLASKGSYCYPGDKPFALCVTHDVDEIYPPPSHSAAAAIRRIAGLEISALAKEAGWRVKGREHSPYRDFRAIMRLEERLGIRSSFYFMATPIDIKRFRYDIEDIAEEAGELVDAGWEAGLHGGYYAYDDLEAINAEKHRLEKAIGSTVVGYRNHYLMFKVPDTWEHLAAAGFKYDTTMGYNDTIGSRNGMCHPYVPYNLKERRECGILEIPMLVMDSALWSRYPSVPAAYEASKAMVEEVKRLGGVLTISWHSNVFLSPHTRHMAVLFEKLVGHCLKSGAWPAQAREIWRWHDGLQGHR